MRILYVITQADGGGAQKYTLCLAKHFGGTVAAGNEAEKLFIDARRSGLTTFELKHLKRDVDPWHDVLAVWEIRQLIKSYNPDIVHLNSSKAGILGSFAAIGTKVKVVFTAHGFVFNEPLPRPLKIFYLALEKIASDYRDFIITVSDADKQAALDNKIIAPKKIATIHNGIPQIQFYDKAEAQKALGLSGEKIIIGSVANFYKTKGLDILINAVAKLDPGIKNKVLCAIIGEGAERKSLEKQISDLGLIGTVRLLGFCPQIPAALKAFDVFVLASRKEGFPYTVLEAMQAGLPIIASQTGGIPEALGEAGFLVRPEDPKELAQVLGKVVSDINTHGPQYFNGLTQKAKARAGGFNQEKMLDETERIYRQLINPEV